MDLDLSESKNIFFTYVCFTAILCSVPILFGEGSVHISSVSVSDSVLLDCYSELNLLQKWKYKDGVIVFDRFFVDFQLKDSLNLLKNYSLLIKPISFAHEGIYQCLQGDIIVAEYWLQVEVPPRLVLTVNGVTNVSKITVEANTFLNVTCNAFGARPAVDLSWENYRELNLLRGKSITTIVEDAEYQGKTTFHSQSALTIYLDRQNGTITCKSITESGLGNREIGVEFNTFVLPYLVIEIRGVNNSAGVFIPEDEPTRLTCSSYGSKPENYLFWFINDIFLNASETTNHTICRHWGENETFNVTSSILFTPQNVSGSIKCVSKLEKGINKTNEIKLEFYTYVMPETRLTINGLDATESIFVLKSNPLSVVCYSYGGRPVAHHSWTVNGFAINYTKNENLTYLPMDSHESKYFNTTSRIHYIPDNENGSITCTSWLGDTGIFKTVHIYYFTYAKDANQRSDQVWKFILITLASVLVVVSSCIFIFKKYLGSWSLNFVPQALYHERKRSYRDFHGPPRLDLPQVPGTSEILDYCPFSEDDYDSYFELKDKLSNHRMFQGKDMCLILNMNSGHLRSRWMGTIAVSQSQKKCVVFSTVNDVTVKNGEIQWDTYVKRVLDMPDNKSLVKLEGVCVNQGKSPEQKKGSDFSKMKEKRALF